MRTEATGQYENIHLCLNLWVSCINTEGRAKNIIII
jgi:hypothetical protein